MMNTKTMETTKPLVVQSTDVRRSLRSIMDLVRDGGSAIITLWGDPVAVIRPVSEEDQHWFYGNAE